MIRGREKNNMCKIRKRERDSKKKKEKIAN